MATLKARYNRIDAGPDTDTVFRIEIQAFSGDPSTAEAQYDSESYLSGTLLKKSTDGELKINMMTDYWLYLITKDPWFLEDIMAFADANQTMLEQNSKLFLSSGQRESGTFNHQTDTQIQHVHSVSRSGGGSSRRPRCRPLLTERDRLSLRQRLHSRDTSFHESLTDRDAGFDEPRIDHCTQRLLSLLGGFDH